VTPEVRSQAIGLEAALRDKLVAIELLNAQSSDTEMAIQMTPLQDGQPWIRVGPGWEARGDSNGQHTFITYGTAYARLGRSRPHRVYVPHLRLHKTESFTFPHDSELRRIQNASISRFLKMVAIQVPKPPRKLIQIALWALSEDIPYASLRPSTDPKKALRDTDFVTAVELLQIMDLLEQSRNNRTEFRLWNDAVNELLALVERYELARDNDEPEAIVSFRKICAFYPLPAAAGVMTEAFDWHAGINGREFRGSALSGLRAVADERAMNILDHVRVFEEDEVLREEMDRILNEAAAGPAR
jgi:hypothetical protein